MTQAEQKHSLSEIYPPLSEERIENICEDFSIKLPKKYTITDLPTDVTSKFSQIFIDKNLKSRSALKCRFLQYLQYSEELSALEVKEDSIETGNFKAEIILEDKKSKEQIWVFILDFCDLRTLSRLKTDLKRFLVKKKKKKYKNLSRIYLVCGKLARKIVTEKFYLSVSGKSILIDFFIEYEDPERPFNDDDILEIGTTRLKAFNFGSLDHLLDAIKKIKGKGKHKIIAQDPDGNRKKIWEGFLFPSQMLKNK